MRGTCLQFQICPVVSRPPLPLQRRCVACLEPIPGCLHCLCRRCHVPCRRIFKISPETLPLVGRRFTNGCTPVLSGVVSYSPILSDFLGDGPLPPLIEFSASRKEGDLEGP